MKVLISCLLVCCSFLVHGKENKDLVRADYYYGHYIFHEAIPYYEKVVAQLDDAAIYSRLGDCYRLTGDMEHAVIWYGRAANKSDCSDATLMRYARGLMQLSRYDEAEKWLKAYQAKHKTEKRAANLIAGCSFARLHSNTIPSGIAIWQPFNTDGADFAPSMWKDRLVYVSDTAVGIKKKKDGWSGNSYCNLYTVSPGNDYTVLLQAKGGTKYHNGPCTFTAGGKQMYYTRNRYKSGFLGSRSDAGDDSVVLLEVMIANYDTAKGLFVDAEPFAYNSKEYSVAHAAISPDGNTLVFVSDMPRGSGGSDLYLCTRKRNKEWSKPENIKSLNTEGEELFPYWIDNNTMSFSSDGHIGIGGLDIYTAKWDDKAHTFSAPDNVGTPVNSSFDEMSLCVQPGGSYYFSSGRPAQRKGDNIYLYHKTQVFCKIEVLDSVSRQPLSGVQVSLRAPQDNETMTISGTHIRQLYPASDYSMSVSKDGYLPRQTSWSTGSSKETDTIGITVLLTQPEKPKRDTVTQLATELVAIRYQNVMDSPGIRNFTRDQVYEVGDFYYDYNKYELTNAHKRYLDTLLTQMNRHPSMRIQVIAHTDCRGSVASNQILSDTRARSVVNYLVAHGIPRRRLEFVGLGSSKPKVACSCEQCTEEQHYLNRILEFKVLQL